MATTALVWLLTLLVLATSAYLYGVQITRLRNKMFNGDLTMPLCRTLADIVRRVPEEATALFPALEDGRFRSCHVAVFSPGGEVYLDSLQPCRGKLPMPPSARQKETFSRLKEKGVLDAGAAGVQVSVFRPCHLSCTQYDTNVVCGVHVQEKGYVVVVDSCGAETQ